MNTAAATTHAIPGARSIEKVDRFLADFLDNRPLPANLTDAIRYALLGGGKRLRPLLVLKSCQAVGGNEDSALAPAAAIELIHCFSLVHDDLPAMDDDDMRRGRPTLHKHAGEAMAILAGDAMTSLAFEMLARRVSPPSLSGQLVRELATSTNDMIAGQVYDTLPNFDNAMEPIERLRTIHRHKTGALIRCACRMGAIAGGADRGSLDAISAYADAIGLMFQVIDDLLDVTQTSEHLGKAAGKDADKGKLTYPGLLGVEASREQVKQLQTAAHQALDRLAACRDAADGAGTLRDLCDYMAVRSR
jgi:geranylgeranyl pyrophosphate synthase